MIDDNCLRHILVDEPGFWKTSSGIGVLINKIYVVIDPNNNVRIEFDWAISNSLDEDKKCEVERALNEEFFEERIRPILTTLE